MRKLLILLSVFIIACPIKNKSEPTPERESPEPDYYADNGHDDI